MSPTTRILVLQAFSSARLRVILWRTVAGRSSFSIEARLRRIGRNTAFAADGGGSAAQEILVCKPLSLQSIW
jgi:hypothetical protein